MNKKIFCFMFISLVFAIFLSSCTPLQSPKNKPPVAKITVYPAIMPVWQTFSNIAFKGTDSYDPDGTIISYRWDFGDGSKIEEGEEVKHTFTTPGIYMVTLTVTDDRGSTGTDTQEIGVVPPGGPPVSSAGVFV